MSLFLSRWWRFCFAFTYESKHFPGRDFHFCFSSISTQCFCCRQSPPQNGSYPTFGTEVLNYMESLRNSQQPLGNLTVEFPLWVRSVQHVLQVSSSCPSHQCQVPVLESRRVFLSHLSPAVCGSSHSSQSQPTNSDLVLKSFYKSQLASVTKLQFQLEKQK